MTVGEVTDVLTSFGPLQIDDLSSGKGLVSDAPFFELERGPWSSWTDASWAVPKMPRSTIERSRTLSAIGKLADKPRLVEDGTGLNPSTRVIQVRVGRLRDLLGGRICEWREGLLPFIRASHIHFRGW